MATITEDYCSKEIYRLLIEKGFDGEVHTTFDDEGYTQPSVSLQMAMKWLREVHNIHIYTIDTFIGFKYVIQDIFHHDEDIHPIDGICFSSNEEACETAIKYCLENIID